LVKVVFSRKGFDSSAGGSPSPIVDGRPVSLYIPTTRRSETTYADAGIGPYVELATRGRIQSDHLCHEDPVFSGGRWALGQTGRSQSHLDAKGIGVGDVFLFFGLFSEPGGKARHHRIFGFLEVEEVRRLGEAPVASDSPEGFDHRHPHTIGQWEANNTLYLGRGQKARTAAPELQLTKPRAPVSTWRIPRWLAEVGLSWNPPGARWSVPGELAVVGRGQEFVADIGDREDARQWLRAICQSIRGINANVDL
jgi:hypothetical protein